MAGRTDEFDPEEYRKFLRQKRKEVEGWPDWKKRAAEASFAPKLSSKEPVRAEVEAFSESREQRS